MSKHIPGGVTAAFHTEYVEGSGYTPQMLKSMMTTNETITNRAAACLLMPGFIVERALNTYNNGEKVTVYLGSDVVITDTGERISRGLEEVSFGKAESDGEISIEFSYPVHNSYIDSSRPKRVVFFEYVETGETDGYGNRVVEDYTYYDGIYFDLINKINVPTKTLRAEDGSEITLTPYGVSRMDKNWAYPEDEDITEIDINSFVVVSSDGERTDILSLPITGKVYGQTSTGWFGSGNFSYNFGTVLNINNIKGVEINGVVFSE